MVRRLLIPVLAVQLVVLLGTPSLALPSDAAKAPEWPTGIEVDVSVEPIDTARTQFMCRARITDLSSGALLSAPSLHVIQGRPSTASSSSDSGDRIVFTAAVGEGGTSASYVLEYVKKGVPLAKQKGAISLTPLSKTKTGV